MPFGVYDVIAPLNEGVMGEIDDTIQNAVDSTQEGLSNLFSENENVLASDVTIHDNRPIYKKVASGFASISTNMVGADGLLTRNPIISPMILVIVVFLIIIRYGRRPIMRLIKRKKKDDD